MLVSSRRNTRIKMNQEKMSAGEAPCLTMRPPSNLTVIAVTTAREATLEGFGLSILSPHSTGVHRLPFDKAGFVHTRIEVF